MESTQEQRIDGTPLPCSFKFYRFSVKVTDITINCEIIKMENSLYLWVGDSGKMEDLSFALMSNFERQMIATKIIGSVVDTTSTNMAKRLSMKLGKPVYISFNVTANNMILPEIERRIHEALKTHIDVL